MGYYGSAGGVYTASAPPGSMTTPNFAMPASNPYTPKSTVKGTGELVSSLIDKLPNGDTKNGLKEYVALLGYDQYYGDSSVGGANAGISSYFSNRFNDPKNSCVKDAAMSFYADIAKILQSKNSKKNSCTASDASSTSTQYIPTNKTSLSAYGCVRPQDRAKIDSVAGEGDFKDFSPGWVWDLALKHAKGDPNSAMFLIGMCGHDDVGQGNYMYEDKSDQALDKLAEQKKNILDEKFKLDSKVKLLNENYDKNQEEIYSLTQQASNLNMQAKMVAQQKGMQSTMPCPPQSSGFYAPRSLGSSADIPTELKNEIKKTQSEVDGAKNTPAKYYHVYGSALMACQLIQNGIESSKASLLQQQAARFYRGLRMCESTSYANENTEQEFDNKSWEPELKKYNVKDYTSLNILAVSKVQKKELDCSFKENVTPEKICNLVFGLGYLPEMLASGQLEVTTQDIREKLRRRIAAADASLLYKKWYLGGNEIMGKKIPCSDIRVLGPSDLMKPQDGFFTKLYKPEGWSDKRFEQASKKLATWDLDFKWTIAQHKAGADFAGKTCKKRAPGEKPLKGICPQGPPDGINAGAPGMYQSPNGGGMYSNPAVQ